MVVVGDSPCTPATTQAMLLLYQLSLMYQSGMHYIECAIIYIALLHQSVIIIHGFTLCESLPNDWPTDEGRYPNGLLLPPGKDAGP